jgi:hypothetical protein
MRYAFALLAFVASVSCKANAVLQEGVTEFRATASLTGRHIFVRAGIATPSQEGCGNWRWGAEAECPGLAFASLQVRVGDVPIFVPRSAFADLGAPRSVSVNTHRRGFNIVVIGGDAATSYTAKLRFSYLEIKSRRVEGGEFKDSAWEETTFSFPN